MIRRLSTALGALLFLAPPVAASAPARALRNTDGTLTAFRDCFIAAQEKASRPWAFVPDETGGGGRFSTVPGSSTYSPYTLTVRDGVGQRHTVLTGEVPAESGPMIATAVDGCLAASPAPLAR